MDNVNAPFEDRGVVTLDDMVAMAAEESKIPFVLGRGDGEAALRDLKRFATALLKIMEETEKKG